MNMMTITGLAVVAVALSTVLKPKNPEYSLLLSLTAGVLILGMIITSALPLFGRIRSLFEATGAKAEYVQILFKALGLCFITLRRLPRPRGDGDRLQGGDGGQAVGAARQPAAL